MWSKCSRRKASSVISSFQAPVSLKCCWHVREGVSWFPTPLPSLISTKGAKILAQTGLFAEHCAFCDLATEEDNALPRRKGDMRFK